MNTKRLNGLRKGLFSAAALLVLLLVVMLPVSAADASGACGTNVVWSYDDGKLVIEKAKLTITAKNLSGQTDTKVVRIVVPNLQSYVFDGLD